MVLRLAATQRRSCRVSQRRTQGTVRRAVNSWCLIFGKDPVKFDPVFDDCSGLARCVKEFLANCPSSVEEERLAFQSIKKLLPPSCKCQENGMLHSLMEGLVRPPSCLPHGYLSFVKREVSRLFPMGWDTEIYRERCYTTSPPLSSTLENSRPCGGGMSTSWTQSEFLSATLGTSSLPDVSTEMSLLVVQSAGKPRPLSKFSEDTLLLKPLHKSIYDHLSTKKWLARGEISPEMLDKAGFDRRKGFLVSGDYKSATDNLPLEVAEAILDVILRKSNVVPEGICSYARRILRPVFQDEETEEWFETTSGQQMGSLLSFPLLCLQNYLAFRWASRQGCLPEDTPLLINGDDILFQTSDPTFFDTWVRVVGSVGLEVERTKTSVSDDFGSLNSTLLRWSSTSLRVVPTLRFGMLRSVPFANSLSDSFNAFARRGLPVQVRYNAGLEFLKWHSSTILRTNLAPHELGFSGRFAWRLFRVTGLLRNVKQRVLDDPAGGLNRSLPKEPSPHNIVLSSVSVDWVPSLSKEEDKMNRREMASWKWRMKDDFAFEEQTFRVRYWLGLSRPAVSISRLLRLGEARRSTDWYPSVKKMYFAPRVKKEKLLFFFKGLDRLPSYGEVVPGDGVLESTPLELPSKSDSSILKSMEFSEWYELLPARKAAT